MMSFISAYIHFVWSTKHRIPYLKTKVIREAMWKHIKENAKSKNILIDHVNGYTDHCHCLISMGPDQTFSKVMQLIKGESAFWFNKQNFIKEKLEWQDEYFAASVSESQLGRVRNYIRNQEEHHKKKSFHHEYDSIIRKYGFNVPPTEAGGK